MNQINSLGCSGHPEQGTQARNSQPEPGFETLAAFSRRLGVARSTVTRAAQAGRLVLSPEGHVQIAQSLQAWHASRGTRDDLAERHAAARGHAIPGAVAGFAHAATTPATAQNAPASPDPDLEGTDPATGHSRALLQAQTLRWQNAALVLALHLSQGTRIPRPQLLAEAQGLGNTLRAAVERLIDQTAPRLAAATNPADQARLLRAEVGAVRGLIRAEFARSIRRLRPEAGAGAGAAQLAQHLDPQATTEAAP
jgi:hypothetical protein